VPCCGLRFDAALRPAALVQYFLVAAVLFTTDLEEEALFALWNAFHGGAVYPEPFRIPYQGVYFNWLFYTVYGSGVRFLAPMWGDIGVSLPAAARCVSIVISGGTIAVASLLLVELMGRRRFHAVPVAMVSAAVWCPLFSFYSLTARPDLGALLCDLIGLSVFWRWGRSGPSLGLIAAVIACYASWAFKHSSIIGAGSIVLYLLSERRWLRSVSFGAGFSALIVATLVGGGSFYRYWIIFSQRNCDILPALALENFGKACMLSPFLVAGIFAAASPLPWRMSWHRLLPRDRFTRIWFLVSLISMLAMSMKGGAGLIYFLPPTLAAVMLLGVRLADVREIPAAGRNLVALVVLAGICQVVGTVAVLAGAGTIFGDAGEVSRRDQDARFRALRAALDTLDGPVFVDERSANVPWIQPHPPNFVYATTYTLDRAAGVPFERGGIGGLIGEGFFQTIVTKSDTIPDRLDDQPITNFVWVGRCGPYQILRTRQ